MPIYSEYEEIQKAEAVAPAFILDKIHFCQVFRKAVNGLLHLFLCPGGWYAMTGDVVAQLALIDARDARQTCQRERFREVGKKRRHVVFVLKFHFYKFLSFFCIVVLHVLIAVLEALNGFLGRFSCSRDEIIQVVGIHIDAIVAVACPFDDCFHSSYCHFSC